MFYDHFLVCFTDLKIFYLFKKYTYPVQNKNYYLFYNVPHVSVDYMGEFLYIYMPI